jgi:UDP:flavonoid glycosyltransferase YjiC (YdhE family)
MHIAILTIGTRGDVQPFVALGVGLKDVGHRVTIATSTAFEALVCRYGLDFTPIVGDLRQLAKAEEVGGWQEAGGNPVRLIRGLAGSLKAVEPVIEQAMRDIWRVCQGADAIIAGGLIYFCGDYIAQMRRLPVYLAAVGPLTPTKAFNHPWFPRSPGWLPVSEGIYNRLSHHLARKLLWQFGRPLLNRAWQKVLDGPSFPFWMPKERLPLLYGYSPMVIPKPNDWSGKQYVTGYWFLERELDWRPPADIVDFLQSGPPPVYVGFGSIMGNRPEQVTEIVLQALRRSSQRGVLMTGWGGLSDVDLPDDVFKTDAIPHDWLFPQMAAVVHHGGSGKTAAGLRAGVPSIIVPFTGDQPFWGQRVYALGVGPKPIPQKRLSTERLAEAITIATTDVAMKHQAAVLGQHIRAEDCVKRAVEIICREGAA